MARIAPQLHSFLEADNFHNGNQEYSTKYQNQFSFNIELSWWNATASSHIRKERLRHFSHLVPSFSFPTQGMFPSNAQPHAFPPLLSFIMSVKLSNGHLIMTFSRRGLNFLKLLLAASTILLIAYFLFLRDETHDYHQLYRVAVSGKKAAWVEAALKTEIDGPYDNSTLVTLCNSKEWIDGLIFKCDIPAGGVVNVRNVILNCVRYAIEAGGTSLLTSCLPAIANDKTNSNLIYHPRDLCTRDLRQQPKRDHHRPLHTLLRPRFFHVIPQHRLPTPHPHRSPK